MDGGFGTWPGWKAPWFGRRNWRPPTSPTFLTWQQPAAMGSPKSSVYERRQADGLRRLRALFTASRCPDHSPGPRRLIAFERLGQGEVRRDALAGWLRGRQSPASPSGRSGEGKALRPVSRSVLTACRPAVPWPGRRLEHAADAVVASPASCPNAGSGNAMPCLSAVAARPYATMSGRPARRALKPIRLSSPRT